MGNESNLNLIHSNYLLDDPWSPVARFRLLSNGVNTNSRLEKYEQVAGDRACLACGNCVDACPVVKQNVGLVFNQNQRTSMALENYVLEECRRCYRCVNSCPQVNKNLKEYASGYRRVEKIVHLFAAFTIISLAATGVIHGHYAKELGSFVANILKYAHRTIGVISLIIPIIYYKLDIKHFRRTVHKVLAWGDSDIKWIKNFAANINSKTDSIQRYEFNPAQKTWYLFIMSLFPLLYVSGISTMLLGDSSKMLHMGFALSFDLMLFVHVYIKFIREWCKTGYKLFKNYQDTKSFVFMNDRQ